jgi:opacity protein-like surface antigen
MEIRKALALAIAVLWAGPGLAADVRLSLGAQGEYDSNIYQRESNVEDDFVILGIPHVELLETEGKFTYDLSYQFPYQRSIQTNALRRFNHIARAGADYHLSDRTQLGFSDRFYYTEALSDEFNQGTPTLGQNNQDDQEILRNRATFDLQHRFTPRLSNQTTAEQEIFSTTESNRSDNQTYSLVSGLDYMLTERQTLGGGVQASYQHFDSSNNDPESNGIFVGPFAAWGYQIDPQSRMRISAGPTWVHSKQESDPALGIQSDSDSRIAVFGAISIDRRWNPTMVSGVSYQRRQDTASGVSGSAILDAVSLTHTWAFAERWNLALRGDWTLRTSATNVQTGVEELDTQRWGASGALSYRITRNLTGSIRYQYAKQDSQGFTAGRFSDFQKHVATLGFNYMLDPIEVW